MTNKREPGYYWVKRKNGALEIAKYYSFTSAWELHGHISEYSDSYFDEIGSHITPEMRYTEEDMKQFANFCYNEELTNEINFTGKLNDWLKQKKNEK